MWPEIESSLHQKNRHLVADSSVVEGQVVCIPYGFDVSHCSLIVFGFAMHVVILDGCFHVFNTVLMDGLTISSLQIAQFGLTAH